MWVNPRTGARTSVCNKLGNWKGFDLETCAVDVRGLLRTEVRAPAFLFFAVLILVSAMLCGCVGPRTETTLPHRRFDFQKDTFAYPNELRWIYGYDANGKWVSHNREPAPTYWLRCFVVTRSARQFFLNAKFAPQSPMADEATYKRLIKQVVSTNPRRTLPEAKKIIIPGYPDLRTFSKAHEKLLKAECGGQLDSYFQRGHWRMVMGFSRKGQERMAQELLNHIGQNQPVVAHIVRFPTLKINHVLLLFDAKETEKQIAFSAYDPVDAERPTTLTFDRTSRSFLLPTNEYFEGGRVDVYEVYHKWNY
jgi:hypothetical protein